MTQTPATTSSQTPAAPAVDGPDMTYTEWVAGQIKRSKWYVGTGAFIAQAMQAETLEEATETGEILSGRDTAGTRYRWLGAQFADSDLEGALPVFAICDVIDPTSGAVAKLAVGGSRVVVTLFRACEKEWFPFDASLESVNLGAGLAALNLVLAPTQVKSTDF